MELKDRIKKVRKESGFKSQQKLAEFLGTSRDAIATYELGRVIPNDVFIQLMAAKLNISYEWLKNGVGDMRDETAPELPISATLEGDDKEIISIYLSLPPEHRRILKNFAVQIAATQKAAKKKAEEPAPKADPFSTDNWTDAEKAALDAKVEEVRRQLILEKTSATSIRSPSIA